MMDLLLSTMLQGSVILCVMCFGMLSYLGGTYWQNLSRPVLRRHIERVLSSLLSSIPLVRDYLGAKSEQKLLFVPDADNEPDVDHEISEPALFRFLLDEKTLKQLDAVEAEMPKMLNVLKDMDKESKIAEFETHQSSMGLWEDFKGVFHVFIVFKTTSETDKVYWWSIEKNLDYIVLQRCRNKENVKDKLYGEERNKVKPIKEGLDGKGTIKDLFAVLWAQRMIPEKYNIFNSNCQSFVTFISQQITQEEYEYKGYFLYSPPESDRNKKMLDLIIILRDFSDSSPLFTSIRMLDINLFDKMIESGKYDINAFYDGFTPLHFAIRLEKTEMVNHLLKPPYSADPTKRGESGMNALQFAVTTTMKAEIFDLLLDHHKVKVDDVDENGQTALHLAAFVSNVVAVQKLIEKGADPNILDNEGQSPLLVAAQERDGDTTIDVLLAHRKVKVDDVDENGQTALHWAAFTSNGTAVQKLIEKGANPNILDNEGQSPLHVAAMQRDGDTFIDVLLAHPKVNVDDVDEFGQTALHLAAFTSNGIAVQKLIEKGANPNIVDKKGVSPLHVAAMQREGIPIIDLLLEVKKVKRMGNVNDRNEHGWTALHCAAMESNEITAKHLIEKGGDLHCRDNFGNTPIHHAVLCATDMNIIDLLLRKFKPRDMSRYRNDESLFLCAKQNVHGRRVKIRVIRYKARGIKRSNKETDLKNSQKLETILKEKKLDINGRDQNGETPLFLAIRANNVNAVRRLLEQGADPTICDNDGLTPFHRAVLGKAKDFKILNLLLANEKVDINETTSRHGMTALHLASHVSNVTVARFLLSKGANPNATNKIGGTPLHAAALITNDMDIVDLLLNHEDVDVNRLDNRGRSALDYARKTRNGHGDKIANLLIERGAVEKKNFQETCRGHFLRRLEREIARGKMRRFSNLKPSEDYNFLSDDTKTMEEKLSRISPGHLFSAIQDSNVESVRLLLKNGAHISAQGGNRANALQLASKYAKTTDLIDTILESGKFDINGVDNEGRTPLHYAIIGTNREINVPHLIRNGAVPNIADLKNNTPLHLAALHAETIETMSLLLENEQVDINDRNSDGKTALHHAIENKNVEMARCLLEKGADPTISDNNEGNNPFHLASALLADTDILGFMLENENKIEIDERNKFGMTALHLAIGKSNVTATRFLLSKGANPKVADKTGVTPLHWAARNSKDMGMVELLLNHKDVDVNCLDNLGLNVLDYAKYNLYGHGKRIVRGLKEKGVASHTVNSLIDERVKSECTFEDVVKAVLEMAFIDSDLGRVGFLIKTGADISSVTWGEEGWNALHTASMRAKNPEILDVILETGQFDINGCDVSGKTALHLALGTKNMFTPHFLLDRRADRSKRDNKDITPLHLAAFHATTSDIISRILKDYQVDINGSDVTGATALHCAIRASNLTTARYLLEIGADPTIPDKRGNTPLHVAVMHSEDSDIFNLLLPGEKKIDVNEFNESGSTALHLAMTTSNGTAARFLLSTGANPNVTDKGGATPLHLAALLAKDMDIIELLLSKEVDVNRLDNKGRNALHYAVGNKHGLSERIANRLNEKGAVWVEGERCRDDLLDECTAGAEATGNSLDNDKAENGGENLMEATPGKVVVDSNLEKVSIPIKKGTKLGKGSWGENVMNALHSSSRYAKATKLTDILLQTNLYTTTVPKCTLDDDNENMVKEVLTEAIADSDVKKIRMLIEMGADIGKVKWGGVNALDVASVFGNTGLVDVFLATGEFDINRRIENGETALHHAIRAKNMTISRHLLGKGADPTIGDNEGTTPFHTAALCIRESDILDLILANNKKIDIDHQNQLGLTALHMAIIALNQIAARFLLSKGANPNVAEKNGITPLNMLAYIATHKDMDIVELLLNHKDTNVNYLDNKGYNALDYAKMNKHGLGEEITNMLREKGARERAEGSDHEPKIIATLLVPPGHIKDDSTMKTIRLFIERGMDISAMKWGENGANALHVVAANEKTTDLIDVILETGEFDINGVDNGGRTPLHYAIMGCNAAINARHLVEKGADPNVANKIGLTPFHAVAALNRDPDILDLFLANDDKLDIDQRTRYGMTALHMAIMVSNPVTAGFLLSKGANPNGSDQNGITPLHVAAKCAKEMDVVKLLVNHKDVNVNYLSNSGHSALHYAMGNEHGLGETIANLLKEKSAAKAEGINHEPKNIAEDSDIETIRFLIEDGQDISTMTWGGNGANALHVVAANEKTTDLIDSILETGKFDIDGVDNDGRTPLHYAVMRPDPVTINARRLIKMGADPGIADKNEISPLHMAARNAESMDLIEILLNSEAVDVNCVDKQGRTPLACARDNKHGLSEKIANRLKEKGAVSIEDEVLKGDLRDECTGEEASGNSLDNDEAENESETENPKEAPILKVVVESNGEKIIQIMKGTNLGKGNSEDHVMNALHSVSRYANATTESRDLCVTTAPRCTSDDDNENMVKEVFEEVIRHSHVEMLLNLIETGADISKVTWGGGINALHAASKYAKTTELLDVILATGGFDINGPAIEGQTALHFAVVAKNVTTARHLLEMGADPTIENHSGMSPFHTAATFIRESDILDLILANNKKFNIDHQNQSGFTALHIATMTSNVTAARFLLSKGANPNVAIENKFTSLHMVAVFAKDMDIVELILNHKDTNVNHLDNKGNNAQHYAMNNQHGLGEAIVNLLRKIRAMQADRCIHEPENIATLVPAGHIKLVSDIKTIRFLIDDGQDISEMTWGENGANALHVVAANEKTTDLIHAILETGKFDIDGVDNDGWTPLHYAILGSFSTKNVPRLIQLGADPNIADKNGITPLHLAAENEETAEFIDIILGTGQCNINGVDNDGRTPLHYAIERPKPITINARRLIKMGADPGSADKNGVTPLHMAAKCAESMDVIEELLNTEAVDVNCVDKQGRTPLACAHDNKHGLSRRIIDRLKESGANIINKNDTSSLHVAARQRDGNELITLLLAHDKNNVDDTDELGRTALHVAALLSNDAVVKHLIEKGANPNIFDEEGKSPLHVAAFYNRGTEILDLILEAKKARRTGNEGIDDVDDKHGMTALHNAAMASNEITAEHLIEKGADIRHRDFEGNTPLHVAVRYAKDMQIINVLLKNIRDKEIDQYKKDAMLLPCAYHNEQHGLRREIIDRLNKRGMGIIEVLQDPKILEALNEIKLTRSKSNGHGFGEAVVHWIKKKGPVKAGTDWDIHQRMTYSKSANAKMREKNPFKIEVDSIARIIGDNSVKMEDKGDYLFQKTLGNVIASSDVKKAYRLFKEFGAYISTLTWGKKQCNALHLASQHAKTNMIDAILETGRFDINGVDNYGWTPLHYTTLAGYNAAINARYLLEKGADPTIRDKEDISPFHLAAMWVDNDFHELRQLIDEKDKSGGTAKLLENLYHDPLGEGTNVLLATTELLDVILTTKKVDVNARNKFNGETALHFALITQNVKTARYLLEKGADPTIANHDGGFTPFHLVAALNRDPDMLDLCLANGNQFDIDHRTQCGMTALHMAIQTSNTVAARFLLLKGADPNAADEDEQTPLHVAALFAKDMDLIEILLITEVVDVNCVNKQGRTPLACARVNKHGLRESIIARLKECGAKD